MSDESKKDEGEEVKKEKPVKLPYMCIGTLLGFIIGLTLERMLFNNLGSGMVFFTGLGTILGIIVDNREKKKDKEKFPYNDRLKEE